MLDGDVLARLQDDHDALRRLLVALAEADDPVVAERLRSEVQKAMALHARLDAELFYPALEAAAGESIDRLSVQRAHEEHGLMRKAFADLASAEAGSAVFRSKAHVLQSILGNHMAEEEHVLFPLARRTLDGAHLERLGAALARRRRALELEALDGAVATSF